ncbi:MAG: bifunctional riboflavin kinase/FAD synthetase [Phycisphaerae bacterium]|nr:bifunctional riboflavin kinase/FAD synthetase [Phycisphaerae bacterium]
MQTIDKLEKIDKTLNGCCLTIGNFDGVHLGHQAILRRARQIAAQLGDCPVVAMTFDPHPVAILHPEQMPRVLTPLPLRTALLEAAGVDYLVVLKDSYQMLTLSPQDFVEKFLMKSISPKAVVEGDDFHFGYGRSGDAKILIQLGKTFGFDAAIVDAERMTINNKPARISSTLIRHLLHKGAVADAAKALSRPYRLMGNVVKGRGKGAELGFPTANIDPHDQIIPVDGVYAGFVSVADTLEELCTAEQKIPAVFSLGRAKTFVSKHPLLIEAHLLDKKSENLYGKYLAMDFIDFIRTQQRFKSPKELTEQIAKDCRKAENILNL